MRADVNNRSHEYRPNTDYDLTFTSIELLDHFKRLMAGDLLVVIFIVSSKMYEF